MNLKALQIELEGDLHFDQTMRILYATDASAYREIPLAVAIPKGIDDLKKLILFANRHAISLIPRTAGTSLAGQVVGKGIVVDVSKYFREIIETNIDGQWVRVQPGVIRDELNHHLKPYGLLFGPETSTANRAMIGGMVGNNSCGANSIVYGSTREHLLEVKALLSDGSDVVFKDMSLQEFEDKCAGKNVVSRLEQSIYQNIKTILSNQVNQKEIETHYPKKSIKRRNTGYALDFLLDSVPFKNPNRQFNFCKLIAGSEGTLAFIYEIKIHVDLFPPKHQGLVCCHFDTVDESLRGNIIALKHNPGAVELIDHFILECTARSSEHKGNRFFVKGSPGAILVVKLDRQSESELIKGAWCLEEEMKKEGLGYHFPLLTGKSIHKIWSLRKAGLGMLSNMPGDSKPVAVVEDTAVDVNDLPEYIKEFNVVLKKYGLLCVHYAHAGSGELHLRPILNLKTRKGNELFKTIATEVAHLVKKYRGSLSGEHGDGRLRSEFIPFMIGEKNYQLLKDVKKTWDPNNIFNPNKIVNIPAMNESLRFMPGQLTPDIETIYDWDANHGIIRASEQCNGSGDCRKTEITGETMCPSYMATRNEKDTTRARANILREVLSNSKKTNRFDSKSIYEVMDLCLSCKGCKKECPSNVDVAKLKGEFLYQYYKSHFPGLRSLAIANFGKLNALASIAPEVYNFVFKNKVTSLVIKYMMGFAKERSIPLLHNTTLNRWYKENKRNNFDIQESKFTKGKVYLFVDEFTNYNDTAIGIKAIKLLTRLGYKVEVPEHLESGRAYISKGLLKSAKKLANKNVKLLSSLVSHQEPIIGIEPSAILTFRDEYPDLVDVELRKASEDLANHTMLFDEFIAREVDAGNITSNQFTKEKRIIKFHGHCHQKALSSLTFSKKVITLPQNYQMHLIPSGCCGMAGSFGYEREHYEVSMKIAELVLFPVIKKQSDEIIIAAPGTSCRHQIKDGTGKVALHPADILYDALLKN